MPESFLKLFLEAEPHLVGIWKYREKNKPPLWYATVLVNGDYFDVEGVVDISGTLIRVIKAIKEA